MLGRVALSLAVALLVVGCAQQDDSWKTILETGVLTVGLDPTYPPFELDDGDQLQGLDVDLARAVAEDLGLDVEFTYFGYDGLYDALSTRQVDVLISALVAVPERTRDFAYSTSYFDAGLVLVSTPSKAIEEAENLVHAKLSVELGAEGQVMATDWERQLPGLAILPYNSPDEAVAAVVEGEADAALVDNVSAHLYRKQSKQLHISERTLSDETYHFAVRAVDEELLKHLNESLVRLKDSGQLDEIVSHWLEG